MIKNSPKLERPHYILIASAVALFCALYFGFDTKPSKQSQIDISRAANLEATDAGILITEAKEELAPQQRSLITVLENDLRNAEGDRLKELETLASRWFEFDYPSISGFYAEEIAKIKNDENAWSIAGTTFSLGLKGAKSEKVKAYCAQHALSAFEKTISLSPANVDHRINQALVYVDYPAKDNPMKGIQMLLGLNDKYPENVPVLTQLGGLAIRTGQYQRAVERLSKAIEIDNKNSKALCLLAQAYEGLGDTSNAELFNDKCNLTIKK